MTSQRGSALIVVLMMLIFLMILGSALLTSVTLDVAIGENYRSETQLLYLAEAGISEARDLIRNSSSTPSQLLSAAAGADGILSASRDLDTLLNNTDDVPILNGGGRTIGKLRADTSGSPAGRYYVFLRNDPADGMTSLTDSNQVLTLLSVAVIGSTRKVLEVTLMKWKFPRLPASLVLDGSPIAFTPSNSGFGISGMDASASGGNQDAVGVLTSADRTALLAGIPASNQIWYPGSGMQTPPPADVDGIDALMDPRLSTPIGLERIVDDIVANASDAMSPGWNGLTVLGNVGNSNDYRIVVVNGDCELVSGTGYGMLLVRGNLRMSGSFHWNGLILVIGQGTIGWSAAGSGGISGNVFVARTRANNRSAVNELGTVLVARGDIAVDFGSGGNNIQLNNPGITSLELVYQKLPFVPIAMREY